MYLAKKRKEKKLTLFGFQEVFEKLIILSSVFRPPHTPCNYKNKFLEVVPKCWLRDLKLGSLGSHET